MRSVSPKISGVWERGASVPLWVRQPRVSHLVEVIMMGDGIVVTMETSEIFYDCFGRANIVVDKHDV